MWLALRAASAANIGNPADVSLQAEEGFQSTGSSLSFPCEAGEGADCRRRSACEQRSWSEGRAPGRRESGGWGHSVPKHVSSLRVQSLQTTKSHSPPLPLPAARAG